jgi:hypothetical protein
MLKQVVHIGTIFLYKELMLLYFSLTCTIDSDVVHTLATIAPTPEELGGKQNIILYQFKLFSYDHLFYQALI